MYEDFVIHAYLNNFGSMIQHADMFLRSLKNHHGEKKLKVVFTTRDLNQTQIKDLKDTYKNLDIYNENFDFDAIAQKHDIDKNQLLKAKREFERLDGGNLNGLPVLWKQFISVQERYRNSIYEIMLKYKESHSYVLHLDIDLFFNRKIDNLLKFITEHDVSIKKRYRKGGGKKRKRIVGYILGLSLNENGFKFVERMRHHIDKIPLKDKYNGYGQEILFLAFRDLKKKIDIGEMPREYTANTKNKGVWGEEPLILSANKMTKNQNMDIWKKLMEKR